MKTKYLIITLLGLMFISSCNKDKHRSKKLMKGENWRVSSLTVDGNPIGYLGSWNVTKDVNIYDSVPSITWTQSTLDAVFEWQFHEKGKTFTINYMQLCSECNGSALDTLDYITNNISGVYKVEKQNRKEMTFTSDNTFGYSGKTIEIKIKR